jgi:hypothetical protein
MRQPYDPYDATGVRITPKAVVRIVGIPDLSDIPANDGLRTREVFRYLVGRYKRVDKFGPAGHVELSFRIPAGRLRGHHTVSIEPWLVRIRRERSNRAAVGDGHHGAVR